MALWKRLILIGFSIGAGFVVAGLGIVFGVYWYQNRPIPPRTWRTIEIQSVGIEAWLKSEWREGSLRYQFRVSPLSPELTAAFDKAAKSSSSKTFTVEFFDDAGFKLCDYDVTPGREVDSSGKVVALVSNERAHACSSDNYRQARNWNVRYVFPKLTKLEKGRKRTPKPVIKKASLEVRASKALGSVAPRPKTVSSLDTPVEGPSLNRLSADSKPSKLEPAKQYAAVGSTKQDVLKVLGQPKSVSAYFWSYPQGTIFFDRTERVTGWTGNFGGKLRAE